MNGSCQGAIRPLVNELHHSFRRSTTRLKSLVVQPTHPTYVPLLPPPSLRSTVQKKKVTIACLPWMSQWPRISARPQPLAGRQNPLIRLNHAGLVQFTPWRSCKCSRLLWKLLCSMYESNPNPSAFSELCSATDLLYAPPNDSPGVRQIHGQCCSSATSG